MFLWNYLGEFLLFQWLFGYRGRNRNVGGSHNADKTDYLHRHYNEDDDFSPVDYLHTAAPSYRGADIYDDEDDALDDYNPTYCDDYQFNSYDKYDHHDYGYSQSYDDFHDEQDDYAIKNDVFDRLNDYG